MIIATLGPAAVRRAGAVSRWGSGAALASWGRPAPTDAYVSHLRTASASVVYGHSAHGVDRPRVAIRDSCVALRAGTATPVVSVPDSLSRSNAEARRMHHVRLRVPLACFIDLGLGPRRPLIDSNGE